MFIQFEEETFIIMQQNIKKHVMALTLLLNTCALFQERERKLTEHQADELMAIIYIIMRLYVYNYLVLSCIRCKYIYIWGNRKPEP